MPPLLYQPIYHVPFANILSVHFISYFSYDCISLLIILITAKVTHMKQISLPALPDGVIVFEYPEIKSVGKCEFYVPAGFEAVVMRDGILSNLYREGDCIRLGAKEGLLGIKVNDPADTHLYICKKQIDKPLKWGVGDIPYYDAPGNPPVLYGANGMLRISIQNMRKLIQNIMGGKLTVDTRKIGKYLDADIAAHVKAKLMESVQKSGLNKAALKPEQLADSMKAALFNDFDRLGIWLETLSIDAVEVMTPYDFHGGQE